MLNKIKHCSCKNCDGQTKITFKNHVTFCFGLIKKTHVAEDYYRFCIDKGKNRSVTEIMLEELHSMLLGLSTILFQKRLNEINKKCSK